MKFTTRDRDNDQWGYNCARNGGNAGGWWYKDCSAIRPNPQYITIIQYTLMMSGILFLLLK